jgi:hypothetical protein
VTLAIAAIIAAIYGLIIKGIKKWCVDILTLIVILKLDLSS